MSSRYLEGSQNTNIQGAQDRKRRIVKRELRLPGREQDVNHVSESIVQGVVKARQHKSASGSRPSRPLLTGRWDSLR